MISKTSRTPIDFTRLIKFPPSSFIKLSIELMHLSPSRNRRPRRGSRNKYHFTGHRGMRETAQRKIQTLSHCIFLFIIYYHITSKNTITFSSFLVIFLLRRARQTTEKCTTRPLPPERRPVIYIPTRSPSRIP